MIEVREKDGFTASGFAESDQHSGLCEKVAEEAGGWPRKRRKAEVVGEKQGEAAVKGILAGYGSGGSEEENDDEESPADLGRQVVKEDKHCKLDEDEESYGSAYSPTCGLW